ncbi:hypothetical protein WBN73_09050 [Paenarthrobacter sp. CCNWLY172]|uniref:hypothetical protein n=1 Tax=Micrococcaceae TaxID=1268 RepID=UPI001A998261|nr:hypothetical protein [Arthrobacter sp. D5-1]QSZ47075.1 hypothetical protein AYX22_00675 [Arthrobacter sp. D5-1]
MKENIKNFRVPYLLLLILGVVIMLTTGDLTPEWKIGFTVWGSLPFFINEVRLWRQRRLTAELSRSQENSSKSAADIRHAYRDPTH